MALLLVELASSLGETFHQDGRCVYADDRVAISLIHETATAPGGDRFDNLAVYISRLRPDGQTDRLWTVDLDAEHCEAFWAETPAHPRRTFPNNETAPPNSGSAAFLWRQIGPFVRQLNRNHTEAHANAISGHRWTGEAGRPPTRQQRLWITHAEPPIGALSGALVCRRGPRLKMVAHRPLALFQLLPSQPPRSPALRGRRR